MTETPYPLGILTRTVRTSGHFDGVEHFMLCQWCGGSESIMNWEWPRYTVSSQDYPARQIDLSEAMNNPCTFTCNNCLSIHGPYVLMLEAE